MNVVFQNNPFMIMLGLLLYSQSSKYQKSDQGGLDEGPIHKGHKSYAGENHWGFPSRYEVGPIGFCGYTHW